MLESRQRKHQRAARALFTREALGRVNEPGNMIDCGVVYAAAKHGRHVAEAFTSADSQRRRSPNPHNTRSPAGNRTRISFAFGIVPA
ncbi:MAG: hypothetical protein K1X51_10755 [Rhodospirillaceae bacterium]|nr:hypothetical protein [Rhodospirillaceae bacterium]